MKLATTLNMYSVIKGKSDRNRIVKGVSACKEAGFDGVDINFKVVLNSFAHDEQDAFVEDMARALDETKMPVFQCHSYFGAFKDWTPEKEEEYINDVKRSIELAGRLSIPWAVVHPIPFYKLYGVDEDENRARNVEFYGRLQEVAVPGKVGLAFENLPRTAIENADQLIALCEAAKKYGEMGVCWDVGHANLTEGMDQAENIMKLGSRIKCTHIHDNRGKSDEHLLPLMGDVPWGPVVKAFKESGYEREFVYEAGTQMFRLPEDDILRMELMKYAVKLGRYLLA